MKTRTNFRRRLVVENMESRHLLTTVVGDDHHHIDVGPAEEFLALDHLDVDTSATTCNTSQYVDTNQDGIVTPIDALLIVNALNNDGWDPVYDPFQYPTGYLDTSLDGMLTPIDVLLVVNWVNNRGAGQAYPPIECLPQLTFDLLGPFDASAAVNTSFSALDLTANTGGLGEISINQMYFEVAAIDNLGLPIDVMENFAFTGIASANTFSSVTVVETGPGYVIGVNDNPLVFEGEEQLSFGLRATGAEQGFQLAISTCTSTEECYFDSVGWRDEFALVANLVGSLDPIPTILPDATIFGDTTTVTDPQVLLTEQVVAGGSIDAGNTVTFWEGDFVSPNVDAILEDLTFSVEEGSMFWATNLELVGQNLFGDVSFDEVISTQPGNVIFIDFVELTEWIIDFDLINLRLDGELSPSMPPGESLRIELTGATTTDLQGNPIDQGISLVPSPTHERAVDAVMAGI